MFNCRQFFPRSCRSFYGLYFTINQIFSRSCRNLYKQSSVLALREPVMCALNAATASHVCAECSVLALRQPVMCVLNAVSLLCAASQSCVCWMQCPCFAPASHMCAECSASQSCVCWIQCPCFAPASHVCAECSVLALRQPVMCVLNASTGLGQYGILRHKSKRGNMVITDLLVIYFFVYLSIIS
jgi:hypothetical protein